MQTTPQPAARNTPWSTHPGYDLSRYTVISDAVNDRERHHPINTAQRVVEVAKGYFAFEPATAGEGGAA